MWRWARKPGLISGEFAVTVAILACSGRSMGDEVQETGEYRTHRQQRGTWHDAVRRQDEHGQSRPGGHYAHGEASPGQGNQLHRYGGRVQRRGERDSGGECLERGEGRDCPCYQSSAPYEREF